MASGSTPVQRHIEICSDEGCKLNVCNAFPKHFKLSPLENLCPQQQICRSCWEALRDVHQFYLRVAAVHNKFDVEQCFVNVADSALDPLPQEVQVQKSDDIFDIEKLCDINNSFEHEVKLEIQELDLLPKIEFIEEPPVQSERAQRACRRRTQIQETSKPISTDVQNGMRSTTAETVVLPKRGRGRPRKLPPIETLIVKVEPHLSESNIKADSSCSVNNSDVNNELIDSSGTNDSAASSSESSASDKSFIAYVPKRRFAVIPKRVVVKPKKYRKRQKPLIPPKRMTQEELEKRNTQQEELDNVIKKFFGGFVCPKCDLLVNNFAEMTAHFRASHDEDIGYMTCCGRKFNKRRSLAEHVYVHWNPDHFKCTKCDKVLVDSQGLKTHELMHRNPDEAKEKKYFHCDKCPKVFSTKYALEDHTYTKHVPQSEFLFPCSECKKSFPTKRKLKIHIKYIHDPETAVICDKCGKQVRSQTYLKKHHQLMHPDVPRPAPTPMQCKICGTWYRHLAGLKQHIMSVHDDSGVEHRCNICNKLSVNARALSRHIYLNHKCEKKFKCTLCEKAFKRPQDIKEHFATHTGQALYTCTNCPVTFVSKANMYKHRKRLHPIEWAEEKNKPKIFGATQNAMGTVTAIDLSETV